MNYPVCCVIFSGPCDEIFWAWGGYNSLSDFIIITYKITVLRLVKPEIDQIKSVGNEISTFAFTV